MSETSAAPAAAAAPAGTGAIVAAAGSAPAPATGTNAPGIEPGATPASSSEPADSGQPAETAAPAVEHDLATELGQVQAVVDMRSSLDAAGISASDQSSVEYIVKRGFANGGVRSPEANAAEAATSFDALKGALGEARATYTVQWAALEFAAMVKDNPRLAKLAEASGAANNLAIIKTLAGRAWQRHCDSVLGNKR